MQTGLYVALSSQMALEKRLNTLADNIANSNTVGFRATEVKFNQVLGDTKPTKVSYVSEGDEYLSTTSGSLARTGATLDFAARGDAWFSIETPAGPALTRDGRFTLTEAGELVTIKGYPVLDAGGAPIQVNGAAGDIKVGADGVIHQNDTQVASLGLYQADFSGGFMRYDNSAVMPAIQPEPVVDRFDVGVMQGFLEESNVNAIQEMTQLIMVTRAFDNMTALMRDSEGSLDEAIKTLGGAR
ncbi:flagellar basal-body rod protein FlgF [Sinorhizobium alkalisoli]|uniref:Flagellar basal-body rod protein FlgF n=1 Tax=Sinorhizobium alkalisoli TaxID=1752398 RepID=A0A1E3V832_9HYPH|nr:flagellar basal-body rod protein FlgF [Sinorhizobium alkalisoli]MCA1489366.1 flagellar basal-body rod protein FlgF [Ensifer sp. NBAIM29]ODR89792.1 flagellar basal-body rod protein FlgF [Sinorhizobium alkalisoli]